MKRDVQVGVTLGVIILAIIGVFLSTRTTIKEPTIPIPELEEETHVGALDIDELSPEPQNASQESFKEVTTEVQNPEQKAADVTSTAKIVEQPAEEEENVIEGEWKKAKEKEPIPAANDTKVSVVSNSEDWKDILSADSKKVTLQFKTHKVKYKDSLRKIANKYYGDEEKWLLIFNANQNKIQDRNSLRVGTELIIPEEKTISPKTKGKTEKEITTPSLSQVVEVEDAKSTVNKHVVQQGDSLYTLAAKYYNDGAKWNKIYEANKKTLKDHKSLKIGQELVIPDL